jgi:undecaprenyl pyrophosphate phosphatase UppP
LVVRFRRARGGERQQLRWVALAAALALLGSVVVLVAVPLGTSPVLLGWVAGVYIAIVPLAIGFVVSFIVALGVVAWFMRWVRARGFAPFAIYRIVFGIVLLVLIARGAI